MVSTKQLGEGKITSLIIKFSGPALVGMLVTSIYNVVDRIYVSRGVGSLGLAGVTVGFPVMMLVMALTALFSIGGTAIVSIRLGEKKQDEAEHTMGNAIVLLFAMGIIISIFGSLFLDFLLTNFGASPNILPYAHAYMRVIFAGIIFQIISLGMNNFIRAEGNPKIAMFTMIIGALINIILDPILIFGFKMGVTGAAVATVFSQAVSSVWVLAYFFKGKSLLKIRPKYFRPDPKRIVSIITVGAPAFFKQISTSLTVVILNKALQNYGGDMAISAFGVVHSVITMLMMPIFGISQGIQPIIGYNYGARQFERVKKTLYIAIAMASVITVTGFLVIVLSPGRFVRLFSSDVALLAMGSTALRTNLSMLPFLGFTIIGSNYFQAVGKPKQAVALNLIRQVFLVIPLLYIMPRYFQLIGVWAAGPAADAISTLLTAGAIYLEVRFLDKSKTGPQRPNELEKAALAADH